MGDVNLIPPNSPRPRRPELSHYYGLNSELASSTSSSSSNPLDINGSNFDSEAYLSKIVKEKSLNDLMDAENDVVQQVRQLDSEMQTLVYENYAKFITATDTIREMRCDFAKMEDEMDALTQNMEKITDFSQKICESLQDRHATVRDLVNKNRKLQSFEFILDLPQMLRGFLDEKDLKSAVKSYNEALPFLEANRSVPSMKGIHDECRNLLAEIKTQLRAEFRGKITSAKDLASAVEMLVQLGDAQGALSEQYLVMAEDALRSDLELLEEQVGLCAAQVGEADTVAHPTKCDRPASSVPSLPVDILEFVDMSTSGFLSNSSLVVTSYLNLFAGKDVKSHQLFKNRAVSFLSELVSAFFDIMSRRLKYEVASDDCSLLVRALDRFYRRIQASAKVLPDMTATTASFYDQSVRIILCASKQQADLSLERLQSKFNSLLTEVRAQLVATKTFLPSGDRTNHPLADLLSKCEQNLVQWIKTVLANLLQLTAYDVTFASHPHFIGPFGVYVRETVVAGFFKFIIALTADFSHGSGDKVFVTPTVVLLLSKLCLNLEQSAVGYLLDLSEQQFLRINQDASITASNSKMISSNQLCEEMRQASQRLLNRFVELEGFALSQMLSKSVETRDWVSCVEPRAVRAVMKRVVEDVTAIDSRVGQLYEEGSRQDRSSDSSRRTGGGFSLPSRHTAQNVRGQWNLNLSASPSENPLLRKLWSEKIDYFACVEFSRVSVVTGVIKICLKTLLECVRLRSFGKYGFQQVQVDAHYLQLYLWRFVSDENLVHQLLEEIMASAVIRCFDPVLMEPGVVEMICERG